VGVSHNDFFLLTCGCMRIWQARWWRRETLLGKVRKGSFGESKESSLTSVAIEISELVEKVGLRCPAHGRSFRFTAKVRGKKDNKRSNRRCFRTQRPALKKVRGLLL
jgi:hypothetical protein